MSSDVVITVLLKYPVIVIFSQSMLVPVITPVDIEEDVSSPVTSVVLLIKCPVLVNSLTLIAAA